MYIPVNKTRPFQKCRRTGSAMRNLTVDYYDRTTITFNSRSDMYLKIERSGLTV